MFLAFKDITHNLAFSLQLHKLFLQFFCFFGCLVFHLSFHFLLQSFFIVLIIHIFIVLVLFVLFVLFVLLRSEEHTSELQSLMRISYAVFCLKKINLVFNNIYSITFLTTL